MPGGPGGERARDFRVIKGGRADGQLERKPIPLVPAIGMEVYVPGQIHVSSGRSPDILGGLARIVVVSEGVSAGGKVHMVEMEGDPGHQYNWDYLRIKQPELEGRYGTQHSSVDWRGNPLYTPD